MQSRQGRFGPPVAAVQRVVPAQAQRACDGAAVVVGQEHHQLPRHRLRQMLQERKRQRRRIAVVLERAQVEAEHRLQVGRGRLVAVHGADDDAGPLDLRPFLADVLAVLVVEIGQEAVEVAPMPRIPPVVLHVDPRQPVGSVRIVLVFRMEVDVRGRQSQAQHLIAHRGQQRLAVRGVLRQQARSGDRRVGHGTEPFGVVVQPVTGIGVRPGMIEDELPVRIVLQVARCGRNQRVALPQRHVVRYPSPVAAQASL